MRRRIYSLILCLSFIFTLSFGIKAIAASPGITVNKLNYEVVSNDNLPREIKDRVNDLREQKAAYIFDGGALVTPENSYYVFIGMGMKPTMGYSINVTRVEDNEGKTVIYVEEKSPAQGEITGQVVTYPYAVIKISKIGMAPNFVVRNNNGENYEINNGIGNPDPNRIDFEFVSVDKLPKEFSNISAAFLRDKGFRILTDTSAKTGKIGSYFIMVQAGEKKTGGYTIAPVSVINSQGKTVVTVKETSPASDAIVTQNINYPRFVIRVFGSVSPEFIVKGIDGNIYKNLSGSIAEVKPSIKTITETGSFVKIAGKNLFINIGKKQVKFRLSDSLFKSTKLKNLKNGQKLSIRYVVINKEYVVQEITVIKK